MIVITDGADRHSVNDWLTVSKFLSAQGIAVFGLRPVFSPSRAAHTLSGSQYGDGWLTVQSGDAFGSLCGSTGGLVLDGNDSKRFLSGQIQRLMTILRNRYIIEFPRPANGSPGYYSIDVKIGDPSAIIRPSGVSFPPRERDPQQPEGTLPTDTSQMPLVGAKHADVQPK
jgi:hypothetical protein